MSMGHGGMGELTMWPASDLTWTDSVQKLSKISVRDEESLTVGSGQQLGVARKSKPGPGTWSPDGMWSPPPDRDLAQSSGSSRSGAFSPPSRRKSDPLETYALHEVSSLDTLAGIAIKYGVQVEDVKRMNGLITDAAMFARKTLRIPPPKFETPSTSPGHSSTNSRRPSSTSESPFPPRPHSKKNMSPAMSSLRGYYGIASPEKRRVAAPKRRSDGEGMEMYTYHSNTASEDEQSAPTSPVSRRAHSENGQRSSRWGMEDDDHLWDNWANKTSTRQGTPSAKQRTSSAAGSTAGDDLLTAIYGAGEDELEAGSSHKWGTSEIEEVVLRDDTGQDSRDNVTDSSGPRRRGVNGANGFTEVASLASSSSSMRALLPTSVPAPRSRSSGGSSSGSKTPPLSGNRFSKPAAVVKPGAIAADGTLVGSSRSKIGFPEMSVSKVRRSSSASSIAEEEGSARLVNKGPSFGSVGDLLTGAVVKRKAAKD